MRPVPAHPASTDAAGHNPVRQRSGAPLVTDLSLDDLERDARHAIGEMAYAYYAGGADDERLLRGNVEAWSHWQLHPHVLAGLSSVSPATTLLGTPVSSPVAIAPTAIQGLAHAEGEVATARGAAAAGALLILSSLATCPLEDVAAAAPDAARWMQIYILRERARTEELVRRAAAHGYRALVLTVDAPVSGLRLREWRIGMHLPDDLALPNLAGDSTDSAREGGFMAVVTNEFEPALTPDDIEWLAGLSDLPVVVKGVQRADDAVRCMEAGATAVVVSNHGARQLADAPATADILAEVVDAVDGTRRGLCRRRSAPCPRRDEGAGARGKGDPDRAPVAVGGGHGRGRRRGPTPRLVRVGAAAHHASLRRGDGRRHRPLPGTPGPRLGPVVTTVAAMLAARAADDRTGVMDGDGRWTWREAVLEGAARGALARSLIGTDKPHVGVLLPNGAEYLFWLNGAALAGAAIVGINPTRRGEALAADVRATDCAMIVTDAEGAALLDGLDLGVDEDKVLVIGTDTYDRLMEQCKDSDAARDLIRHADDIDESALYLLIFTSGTTGVPKAVRCTQGRLAGIAEVAGPGYGYTPDDVCYCPMPLFHGNALMALWGPTVLMGAAIAVRPRFSASAFLDDVRRYGATKFSYVGKAIAYILATPERPDDADNTLKSAFGTEASVRDRDRFRARFGCYLIEGYGQSEGGAAINPVLGMPKGALGKPVDGVDLTVISPETGEECPPAEFDGEGRLLNAGAAIGELVNRSGRGSFEGYYRREDAEQERLRRGWYWTGDLGYVDADGFFYFAGRTGDWLRVDSENFAAGPVEAIISRHPDLAVAAVYPVPDTASGAGDQVMVAVEMVPGKAFDPEAFADWLMAQPDLGPKWLPRYVRVSPSLPQTATGKVTKVGLRAEAWACDDPVWWRPLGSSDSAFALLTDDDRTALAAGLAENGRPPVRAQH